MQSDKQGFFFGGVGFYLVMLLAYTKNFQLLCEFTSKDQGENDEQGRGGISEVLAA